MCSTVSNIKYMLCICHFHIIILALYYWFYFWVKDFMIALANQLISSHKMIQMSVHTQLT